MNPECISLVIETTELEWAEINIAHVKRCTDMPMMMHNTLVIAVRLKEDELTIKSFMRSHFATALTVRSRTYETSRLSRVSARHPER